MTKLRFPEAGLVATLGRHIQHNPERSGLGEPCFSTSEEGCNTSTVLAWYTLKTAGFITHGYNGRHCPHGYPTSGATLGYIYDNYVGRALRFPCEAAVKQMLHGSVAVLMFKNIRSMGGRSELDLWITDNCRMMKCLEKGEAEEVWVWALGNFNYHTFGKVRPKQKRAAKAHIF